MYFFFFFFNDTATTEIYTLSLHDALPIFGRNPRRAQSASREERSACGQLRRCRRQGDRKSTRLNSSHSQISYAVFCLKKKKKTVMQQVADGLMLTNTGIYDEDCVEAHVIA